MENPAEVQELRNKLRMMKFPQDEILNTVRRQQRAIHKQKQANETIRNEIDQFEAQLSRIEEMQQKYATDERLLKLESQKKNLTNKLSVLQADFSAEDQKRRRLEEEVSKARSKSHTGPVNILSELRSLYMYTLWYVSVLQLSSPTIRCFRNEALSKYLSYPYCGVS